MQFRISKTNNEMQWVIVPLFGKFEDQVVAVADAVNMTNARFVARSCVGEIKAVWGLEILNHEIYHDRETLRGLMIGKSVDINLPDTLYLDYDGFWDITKHKCTRARRVLCFCDAIYAKGAE